MIKWSDEFSVKYTGIDEQHKKLIAIIEQIAYLIRNNDHDFSNLVDIVNELDFYVIEHFNYEEALMTKYSYPDALDHVMQHNELREKLKEISIFDIGVTTDFYGDMLAYLVNWLSDHIMQTDKKLGLFLSQKSEKMIIV